MNVVIEPPYRIVILGALSAVAEAVARTLAEDRAELVLVARDAGRLAVVADDLKARGALKVETAVLDLADPALDRDALMKGWGPINAVLIAYGALGDQEAGVAEPSTAQRILDVNFTSAAQWVLAAARSFEAAPDAARDKPVVVAISSVAGDRGRQSNFIYGAAKGGLATLMEGLAHRFARNGKGRAVVVKPGFIDTPMTDGFDKSGPLWASPEQVAGVIVRAMKRGGPVVYAPWFWRWILLVIRFVPFWALSRTKL